MKLQKILSRFLKLHPKEIDLSLDRILNLCEKLGNPQDKIKAINVVGTNGKNSTIQACYSILKEANIKCNVYTSPHIQKINERFVFNNQELKDDELADLFEEVEKVNNNQPITFFEILTACYFYKAAQYPENINLVESGLFFRFDATNILKKNLATIITSISKDHLDWLPKNQQTIEKIVYEKTNIINQYTEDQYLRPVIAEFSNEFPKEKKDLPSPIKILSIVNFESIIQFIEVHEDDGLEYIVVDETSSKTEFLQEIYNNEKKYPFLEKIYDSSNSKYKVKLFWINYSNIEEGKDYNE